MIPIHDSSTFSFSRFSSDNFSSADFRPQTFVYAFVRLCIFKSAHYFHKDIFRLVQTKKCRTEKYSDEKCTKLIRTDEKMQDEKVRRKSADE